MLVSTQFGCAPSFMNGFGAAPATTTSSSLARLQTALVGLSTATRNPAINPGSVAGTLTSGLPDDRTMSAVAASMGLLGPKLPTWANVALSLALGLGASTDKAKQGVISYADELTKAAIAATITAPYYTKPEVTAPVVATASIFDTSGPWYKTWWGVGAIAVGALGVLSLLASRRPA